MSHISYVNAYIDELPYYLRDRTYVRALDGRNPFNSRSRPDDYERTPRRRRLRRDLCPDTVPPPRSFSARWVNANGLHIDSDQRGYPSRKPVRPLRCLREISLWVVGGARWEICLWGKSVRSLGLGRWANPCLQSNNIFGADAGGRCSETLFSCRYGFFLMGSRPNVWILI